MNDIARWCLVVIAGSLLLLAACAPAQDLERRLGGSTTRASTAAGATRTVGPASAAGLPRVIVHKSATCACCAAWVEHMRGAGFSVAVRDTSDLDAIKDALGVPSGKRSCHTAEVGGYFVEGHVPATDVKRLLSERTKVRGLTVPGMPLGSPGMEVPDGSAEPYVVEQVAADGSNSVFAKH